MERQHEAAPAKDAATAQYLSSCKELNAAISALEGSLIAFAGKEEGIKGNVFAQTRARLQQELAATVTATNESKSQR